MALLKGPAALAVGEEVGDPVLEGGEACSPDFAKYLPLDLGGPVAEARARNIEEGALGWGSYPRGAEGAGPKGPGPCDLGLQLRCHPRPRAEEGLEASLLWLVCR